MNKQVNVYRSLCGIHVLVVTALLLAIIISSVDYHFLLLVDDGYYNIAKGFSEGKSLAKQFLGPGLPLIYSIIHLFPENLHPFIRLLLSLSASLGVIVITLKIAEQYLTPTELFWGGLVFIFNPVYVHWVVKSSTDIYLALCLALFIYFVLRFNQSEKMKDFIFSLIPFSFSIFIKPVFILIPFFLLFTGLVTGRKKLAASSLVLLLAAFSFYKVYEDIRGVSLSGIEKAETRVYGKAALVEESFRTNYLLKTKQFRTESLKEYKQYDPKTLAKLFKKSNIKNYNINDPRYVNWGFQKFGRQWISEYFKNNPEANFLKMNWDFTMKKPGLVIQKILLSPFLFLGQAARTPESFVKLLYSLSAIILGIVGLRKLWPEKRNNIGILIILSVVLGFASVYMLLHATSRYSLPVIPLLTVWSGVPLSKLISKFKTRSEK